MGVADGLKWLGWVSFGYQGHAHNLFGRILAHEAICAVSREMLVRSIEAAHDLGFRTLGANTDSLYVQRDGARRPADFQPLIDEIERRTGLIIELEGIFDWLAFPHSKMNPRIGASNRYFGRFWNGELKIRGIALRREDSPNWIAAAEGEILALLAGAPEGPEERIPQAVEIARRYLAELYAETVPVEDLVTRLKLSRELEEYRGQSEAAKAARQLRVAGISVRVGQRVPLVYIVGERPGAQAWGLEPPGWRWIDKARYRRILLRTVHNLLEPFGVKEDDLASMVVGEAQQLELWAGEEDEWRSSEESSLAEELFKPYLPR
jgi:DNA polymerase-2